MSRSNHVTERLAHAAFRGGDRNLLDASEKARVKRGQQLARAKRLGRGRKAPTNRGIVSHEKKRTVEAVATLEIER